MENKESEGIFINDIVKEYPDMIKIIIYTNGYFQPKNNGFARDRSSSPLSVENREKKNDENTQRSVRRSQ